jgi:peptide deformylase
MLKKALGFLLKPVKVLKTGHPILRVKAEAVKPIEIKAEKTLEIVDKMKVVFDSKITSVIGLSAPQVGYSSRIIAYQVSDPKLVLTEKLEPVPLTFLINPEIQKTGNKIQHQYEFCESIPNYSGLVPRNTSINVKALDLDGNLVNRTYNGFLARIIQHEIDHLDGICFIDKMEKKSLRHDEYFDKYDMHL